jgi:hypothetical protein
MLLLHCSCMRSTTLDVMLRLGHAYEVLDTWAAPQVERGLRLCVLQEMHLSSTARP